MKFDFDKPLKKVELVEMLKDEADEISVRDIMEIYTEMNREGKYVQKSYHNEYIKFYIKSYLKYLKDLKTDETPYRSYVDMEKLRDTVEHLESLFERHGTGFVVDYGRVMFIYI